MADGIRLSLDDSELSRELDRLDRAAINPTPAYHAIGGYLVASTQRRFETESDPDGAPWAKLKPATVNRRIGRRRRGSANILRVTTRLYRSINYEATANSAEVGSNIVYAAIHQLGGVIDQPERKQRLYLKTIRRKGRGKTRFSRAGTKGAEPRDVKVGAHKITIPARPYLGLSQADRQEIGEIVNDHLRGQGGQGGGSAR